MMENYTEFFESERPSLIAIAYQMLGEQSSAQDLVQDTWLIWNKTDKTNIKSPPAWLRTVITRLAIDALKSAKRKREIYIGPWLPEPLIHDETIGPYDEFNLARECELALMWAMERLTVEERSAFILRKVFDSDYSELSSVLGKSEANCRKIVSRASKSVADTKLKFNVTPALRPLLGASEVTSVLLSILRKSPLKNSAEVMLTNGQPAIVITGKHDERMVLTIGLNDECSINWIYIMRNPDKLERLANVCFD